MGFLKLAKEDANIDSNNMMGVFQILASRIHPLTLGTVKRSKDQVKYLAETLLHLNYDKTKIQHIVKVLTEERFSHQYIIDRDEAKIIGLKIKQSDKELDVLIMELYNEYVSIMKLNTPFDKETQLFDKTEEKLELPIGIIESNGRKTKYILGLKLLKQISVIQIQANQPPIRQETIVQSVFKRKWELEKGT